ncbi:hypothetical protein A4A49_24679 [Nicotiana attenuata]|uniref:DUF4283 domain-containing protein n=1 Tax=Nicotiana attenuata TaxID=49451 RepID=A0A1J6KUP4_NICAT|nr:hypothetical protein A4A49_24679 [Nicotiana attenuata]
MEPPGSADLARPEHHSLPPGVTNKIVEGIAPKLSYANSVAGIAGTSMAVTRHPRESVVARQTTHNGMLEVIFKAKDYYGIMAEECKHTIVGRFLKPRPEIDRIRSRFREQFSLKGNVKIGVYDNFNVFLDFTTEEDFKNIWYRRVIEIEGRQMWLQKWSPDFKPEEDSPIAPVWVLLRGLPFNMHSWHYVKQILSSVGTPLTLDVATSGKTRPSMAKARVEIDLLKPQLESVWVGKLGHNMMNCRLLEKKSTLETKREEKNDNPGTSQIVETSVMGSGKTIEVAQNQPQVKTTGSRGKEQIIRDKVNRITNDKGKSQVADAIQFQANNITDHKEDPTDGKKVEEKKRRRILKSKECQE